MFKNAALKLPTGEIIVVVLTELHHGLARVEIPVRQELPAQVMLIEHSMKIRAYATVVWQRDGAAALKLLV